MEKTEKQLRVEIQSTATFCSTYLLHNCTVVSEKLPSARTALQAIIDDITTLSAFLEELKNRTEADTKFFSHIEEKRQRTIAGLLLACKSNMKRLNSGVVDCFHEIKQGNKTNIEPIAALGEKVVHSGRILRLEVSSHTNIPFEPHISTRQEQAAKSEENLIAPGSVIDSLTANAPPSDDESLSEFHRQSYNSFSPFPSSAATSPEPPCSERSLLRKVPFTEGYGDAIIPTSPKRNSSGMSDAQEQEISDIVSQTSARAERTSLYSRNREDCSRRISSSLSARNLRGMLNLPRRPRALFSADGEVAAAFASCNLELEEVAPENFPELVRIAYWWILKSENALNLVGNTQAYVALLKAAWIIYDVILGANCLSSCIRDLYDSITYLAECIERILITLDKVSDSIVLELDLEVLEGRKTYLREARGGIKLEAERWLLLGKTPERTIMSHRTFVNAQISTGPMTMSRPYMLVQYTEEGHAEPRMTLLNQECTLELTRDILYEDTESISSEKVRTVKFGDLKVEICFASANDADAFFSGPKDFFQRVKDRLPKVAKDEVKIAHCLVSSYEKLDPSTGSSLREKHSGTNCEVRIYETNTEKVWQASRRLVISSAAHSTARHGLYGKTWWAEDYFLPLTRVSIQTDIASASVTFKWSDCLNRITEKSGDGSEFVSYVYDRHAPNNLLILNFASVEAMQFECVLLTFSLGRCILYERPDSAAIPARITIHGVQDAPLPGALEGKEYKALQVIKTVPGRLSRRQSPASSQRFKCAEVFYLHRDLDFHFSNQEYTMVLRNVMCANYLSNYIRRPPNDYSIAPAFSAAERTYRDATLHFSNEDEVRSFFDNLSPTWGLLLRCRVHHLSFTLNTPPPKRMSLTRFLPRSRSRQKEPQRPADIFIWKQGSMDRCLLRFTARWTQPEHPNESWISTSIDPKEISASNTVVEEKVKLQVLARRGAEMDLFKMESVGRGGTGVDAIRGEMSVVFGSHDDRAAFAKVYNRYDSGF